MPASVFVLALAVAYLTRDRTFLTADTLQVLGGVGSIDHCLHAHIYSRCESKVGPIGAFPPAQYLVALAAKRLGASYDTASRLLLDVNALSAVGVVALLAYAGRRLLPARLAPLLVIVGLTGPLLWYSEAGFGEALAMLLMLAAGSALLLRARWPVVAILFFLAGLTKETTPIFLVPYAGAVILARRERLGALLPVAAAGLGAALFNGLFNVLRYGTLYNQFYNEPARLTPGVGLKAQFVAGQLVAPNAGLVWFWPAATLLLATALALGLRRRAGSAIALTATIAGLLAAFAAYHSPYGWNALGPRHLLPWAPALCLAAATIVAPPLERAVAALTRRTFPLIATGIAIFVLSLAQIGLFLKPLAAFSLFADDAPPCYYVAPDVLEAYEHPNYYDCVTHLGWGAKPILLEGFRPLLSPLGIGLSALLALTLASAAREARRGSGRLGP